MARKKSRKKAQFGGLSAAAIKRAQEQAKQAAKKPTPSKPAPTSARRPAPPKAAVSPQPPVRPAARRPAPPKAIVNPTPTPKPVVQPPVRQPIRQPVVQPPVRQPTPQPPVSVRRPPPPPKPAPQPVVQSTPTMGTGQSTFSKTGQEDAPGSVPQPAAQTRQVAPKPVPWQYKKLGKMHYQTPDSTRNMAPNQAEVVRRAEQEQLRLFNKGEYEKAQEIAVKIGQLSTAQNAARGEASRRYGVRTTDHEFQKGWKRAKLDETNVGFGGLDQYINMEGIDQLNPYKGTWGKTTPGQQADLGKAWETKDPSNLTGPVLAEYNRLLEKFGGKPSGGGITVGGVRPAGQPTQNIETGQRRPPPPPADGKQIFRDPRDRLAFTLGMDRATLDQLGLDEARKLVAQMQGGTQQQQTKKQSTVQPVSENLSKTIDIPFAGNVTTIGRVDKNGNMYTSFNNGQTWIPYSGTAEAWNAYWSGEATWLDPSGDDRRGGGGGGSNNNNNNSNNNNNNSNNNSGDGTGGGTGQGDGEGLTGVTGDKGFGPRIPVQTPEYGTPLTMTAETIDRPEKWDDRYGKLYSQFQYIKGENWMDHNWFKTRGKVPIQQGVPWAGAQQARTQDALTPSQMKAIQAEDKLATQAAQGTLSEEAIQRAIQNQGLTERAIEAKRNQLAEQEALSVAQGFDLSTKAEIDAVTGETYQLAATPDAEKQQREAITGSAAEDANAAQIIGTVGYEAAKARNFTGEAAKGAAASMVAQVGNIPQDIASSIVEDPAEVEAQVDTQPVEVQAAIAALPTEALVSSQMETLLAGLDDGEAPVWARPALELVNQNLAQRGLDVSSVGRDSMFNAIIQSAMPIAQANAQALQARAAQNLSNQQQANLAQTTADMQIRMANLSNQQTAESQTAQMAQNMSTLQSQFSQQALLTSAEREQAARLQNLQNQQQAATLNAQNQQAINAQELGNEQQVELAELQLQSTTERENVTAENQRRLTEMQVAADFLSKNAGFKQQMEVANLSNEQQMRLANLTALNQAGSENLNASQQTELANLNKTMQVNTTQANIASQMNLAQLNVDQQRAVQNAMTVANLDMAKFNEAQQVELANSKFMQTMTLTNFNAEQQAAMQNATAMASLDMATLEGNARLQAQNAQSFLQMDMANLSNEQQGYMLDSQQRQQTLLSDQAAANAAEQFNATSDNQTNQFMAQLAQQIELSNAQAINQMRQFNVSMKEQENARVTGQDIQMALADQQMSQQVQIFNRQRADQRYQFNSQNKVQIEQAYLTYLRNASMADTAAQNEANRINVQNSFAMTAAEQAFMYQQLRDEAAYIRQSYENDETRNTQLYIAAIGNESAAGEKGKTSHISSMLTTIKTALGII